MFLKYVKKYWFLCLLTSVMVIAETVVDLWQPTLMSSIVDDGVLKTNLPIIWQLGIRMIIIVIGGGVTGILGSIFGNMASQNVGYDLRRDLFTKIMRLSRASADRFSAGSLVNRLSSDVTQVQDAVKVAFRGIARYAFMLLGGIYMLYTLKPVLALVALCSIPFLVFFVIFFLSRSTKMFMNVQKSLDGISNVMQEDIKGGRVVKTFAREEGEISRFEKANAVMFNSSLHVQSFLAFLTPCMNIVLNLCVAAIILIGGIDASAGGSITPGQIMAAITYFAIILTGASVLGNLSQTFIKASASWKRIKEVMLSEDDITDGNEISGTTEGKLEFKDVSFTYPGVKAPALSGISFSLNKGETLGIIGPTGCGKSTLACLIPRLSDATSGEILVDGINVKSFRLSALRDRVSLVLQRSEIYSRSIKDNIGFGRPDAGIDEIKAAAAMAQADGFIEAMSEGYDTPISESGHSLSGGQKQRIAIARALLRSGQFLILDDSTSALDLKTEAALMDAVKASRPGLTKIIIAQRIASIRDADLILVLDGGRMAGLGSHDKLLDTCPLYTEIYNSQLKGGESIG